MRWYARTRSGRRLAGLLLPALVATGCGGRPSSGPPLPVVEFEEGPSAEALASGWSGFEKAPDGTTFVWAEGTEAVLRFGPTTPGPRVVRLRAWAFDFPGADPQVLTVLVNDCRVGRAVLPPTPSELTLPVPWSVLREDANVIRLRFSRADAPRDRVAGATDGRRLSAAFDQVRIEPLPSATD